MSTDIQVISLVDAIEVTGLSEIVGASPRTLKIQGPDGLQHTSRVIINGLGVDSFLVVSNKTLHVYPPEVLGEVSVSEMSVQIASSRHSGVNKPATLLFGPTTTITGVSGIQKVIQKVVKNLLTAPGTNRFSPEEGAGLVQKLSLNLSEASSSAISTALAQCIQTVQDQIVDSQAGDSTLLLDEKLMSLTLNGLSFNRTSGEVTASVLLVTYAGQEFDLPVTL